MAETDKGPAIWLTGIPSAGKTTLAIELKKHYLAQGYRVQMLDGDELRKCFSKGVGFSKEDRNKHLKRVGFLCNLLAQHGVVCICSLIAPYEEVRRYNRALIGNYFEVFVKCSLSEAIKRDVKGLYQKAISGEVSGLTGYDAVYEEPSNPECTVDTDILTIQEATNLIIKAVKEQTSL